MEKSTLQKQLGFEEKIPELERTLEAVELLQIKKVCILQNKLMVSDDQGISLRTKFLEMRV